MVLLAVSLLACKAAEQPPGGSPSSLPYQSAPVDQHLSRVEKRLQARGFARSEAIERGFLVRQGSDVQAARMRSGACYVLVAVGSEALEEIGLRVFDSVGSEVAASQGSAPALLFCPTHSGEYYRAVQSLTGSGLFGLLRLRGPAGLGEGLEQLMSELQSDATASPDPPGPAP